MEKILPAIMIVISIGASIVYGVFGDWRHSVYWGAAAVLNIAVTF